MPPRTGTKAENQKLSDERATAVVLYLRNQKSIPMRRLLAPAGYGATHPAASQHRLPGPRPQPARRREGAGQQGPESGHVKLDHDRQKRGRITRPLFLLEQLSVVGSRLSANASMAAHKNARRIDAVQRVTVHT